MEDYEYSKKERSRVINMILKQYLEPIQPMNPLKSKRLGMCSSKNFSQFSNGRVDMHIFSEILDCWIHETDHSEFYDGEGNKTYEHKFIFKPGEYPVRIKWLKDRLKELN